MGRSMRALCRTCSSKTLLKSLFSWQLDGAILDVPPLVMAAESERAGGSATSLIGWTISTSARSFLRAVTCRTRQRGQRRARWRSGSAALRGGGGGTGGMAAVARRRRRLGAAAAAAGSGGRRRAAVACLVERLNDLDVKYPALALVVK